VEKSRIGKRGTRRIIWVLAHTFGQRRLEVPRKGNAVFRSGNTFCWAWLHVGVYTGSRSRRNGLLYVRKTLYYAILPISRCFLPSSYRQHCVAVQCNTGKGPIHCIRRFLSAPLPTEPPSPRLAPERWWTRAWTPFVYFMAARMPIVMGRDANAASRSHEGHKNSKNRVTLGTCG